METLTRQERDAHTRAANAREGRSKLAAGIGLIVFLTIALGAPLSVILWGRFS
ncbi:hypothetical protein Q0812_13205 [Brevundimonas sp. 2R-24]|uniref:Uncharacterized protein n=1 Tax=Peiella sedimenti TaxID=3061083 RepID=A0ABT8SPR5_9CAUL|nr:hypothetical protein [Caulobacteraceae bacterium XZ-24]